MYKHIPPIRLRRAGVEPRQIILMPYIKSNGTNMAYKPSRMWGLIVLRKITRICSTIIIIRQETLISFQKLLRVWNQHWIWSIDSLASLWLSDSIKLIFIPRQSNYTILQNKTSEVDSCTVSGLINVKSHLILSWLFWAFRRKHLLHLFETTLSVWWLRD